MLSPLRSSLERMLHTISMGPRSSLTFLHSMLLKLLQENNMESLLKLDKLEKSLERASATSGTLPNRITREEHPTQLIKTTNRIFHIERLVTHKHPSG